MKNIEKQTRRMKQGIFIFLFIFAVLFLVFSGTLNAQKAINDSTDAFQQPVETFAKKNILSVEQSFLAAQTFVPDAIGFGLRFKFLELNTFFQPNWDHDKIRKGVYLSKGLGGTFYAYKFSGGLNLFVESYYIWDLLSTTTVNRESGEFTNSINDAILFGVGFEAPFYLAEAISHLSFNYRGVYPKKLERTLIYIRMSMGADKCKDYITSPYVKVSLKYYLY